MPFSDIDPVGAVTCGILALISGVFGIVYRKELADLYKKLRKIGYPPYPPWVFVMMGLVCLIIGIIALISGISRW